MIAPSIIKDTLSKADTINEAVVKILAALGEDISRPGLQDTPKRVADSFLDLTNGYGMSLSDVVGNAIFPCQAEGMVIQTGIEFFSLCEHHLLPFFGEVHVAYLPNQHIIGLSKIGRIIDLFAKRLQVQENLTYQIAHAIDSLLKPKGVAVQICASHFCMMMRGVKKQGAQTITTEFSGTFARDTAHKADFIAAIRNKSQF